MSIASNAAQRIETARKARGLTIMELSDELGIAKSSVQRYLKGESALRTDTLEQICKTLDIPLGELSDNYVSTTLLGEVPDLSVLAERTRKIHPKLKPIIAYNCMILEELLLVSDALYKIDAERKGDGN